MKYYEKVIKVRCSKCKKDFDEKKVEFVGIKEDIQGRDLLTFVCPDCGNTCESYRFG